jgi:DNA-binding response OmpR family regulator
MPGWFDLPERLCYRVFTDGTEAAGVKRIVVVDPDRSFCAMLKENLEESQIKASFLKSEKDFWADVGQEMPDLVVLNFDYNEGEGTKIFSSLKMNTQTSTLPVIITSAGLSEHEIEPYAKLWGVHHMPKPVAPEALRTALAEHLGGESLRTEVALTDDFTNDSIDRFFDSIFPEVAHEEAKRVKKEHTDYQMTVQSSTFEGQPASSADLPDNVPELREKLLRANEALHEKELLNERFRDRVAEASRTAEDYRKRIEQMTEDANFRHREVEASEAQAADWQRRHDDLQAELEGIRQGAAREAVDRATLDEEREVELARLRTENESLRQEVETARGEESTRLAELSARNRELDSQASSLEERAAKATEENERLAGLLQAQKEREKVLLRDAEAKATQLEAETIVLKQRLGGLEAERREAVDKLEKRLRQMEGAVRDERERYVKATRLLEEALGLMKDQFEIQ